MSDQKLSYEGEEAAAAARTYQGIKRYQCIFNHCEKMATCMIASIKPIDVLDDYGQNFFNDLRIGYSIQDAEPFYCVCDEHKKIVNDLWVPGHYYSEGEEEEGGKKK